MRVCKVDSCDRKVYGHDLCNMHYQRQRRYGRLIRATEGHGLTKTPEYKSWVQMKKRCNNPTDPAYSYYGGRGIKVCLPWQISFSIFFQDMGPKPFDRAHLERIDNERGYYPDNCRWTSAKENMRNRSYCKLCMEDARSIRKLRKDGVSARTVAVSFGVSLRTVYDVLSGRSWNESSLDNR